MDCFIHSIINKQINLIKNCEKNPQNFFSSLRSFKIDLILLQLKKYKCMKNFAVAFERFNFDLISLSV